MTHPFYQERVMQWPYGWHGTATGQFEGISEYINESRARGLGVNFLSTDSAGIIAGEILPIQQNDAVGFRFTSRPEVGDMDRLPVIDGRYVGDPIVAFNRNYDLTDQYYPNELRPYRHQIWHTYVNEPNTYQGDNEPNEHDIEYLATGFLHLAQRSLEDNRRYAFAGWAGGNPHEDFWYHPKTEELLRLAAANPDMIAVNGHLYSLNNGFLLANFDFMVARYLQMYKACVYFGIPPLFWFAGEAGWGEDDMSCSNEEAIRQMSIVQERFIEDRFWGAWCGWALGKWNGQIVEKMIRLSPDNTEMVKTYQPVTIPAIGEPPVNDYKSVIVKIAQEHTRAEWSTISGFAYDEYMRSQTASLDNAIVQVLDGNSKSFVYVVDPSLPSQVLAIAEFDRLGIAWKPILLRDEEPTEPTSPLEGLKLGYLFEYQYSDSYNGGRFNDPRSYGNKKHEGLDADVIGGQSDNKVQVLCTYDGVVERSLDSTGGYGKYVRVLHGRNGSQFYTRYCHLDDRFVTAGDVIRKGEPVGEVGATGNVSGEHVHLNLEVPGFGLSGYVVADVVDPWPYLPEDNMSLPPVGSTPPIGESRDLLPYLMGDGRLYEVRNSWGGQERFQTQLPDLGTFDQTKNSLAERLYVDGHYIYRGIDISPGGNRFYIQQEPRGTDRARWMRRYMAIGESFTVSLWVQFYNLDCGLINEPPTGSVTDTRTLREHYPEWTSRAGITVKDVIRITWDNGGETYFYARDYGLVGWERTHQDPNTPAWSAISEEHAPGQRPDNVVVWPNC